MVLDFLMGIFGLGPFALAVLITIVMVVLLISPIDFIPEIALGPIGLIDDVLYIGVIVITWISLGYWEVMLLYFKQNPLKGSLLILLSIIALTFIFRILGSFTKYKTRKVEDPYILSPLARRKLRQQGIRI
jgi:uncharacterized membrane protein YkvA (DUF1232 family)